MSALLVRNPATPRRLAGLLRRAPTDSATYRDPLFQRPDVIEDDYYRLRRPPRYRRTR